MISSEGNRRVFLSREQLSEYGEFVMDMQPSALQTGTEMEQDMIL